MCFLATSQKTPEIGLFANIRCYSAFAQGFQNRGHFDDSVNISWRKAPPSGQYCRFDLENIGQGKI